MSKHKHKDVCAACNAVEADGACPACHDPICLLCMDRDGLGPVCTTEGEEGKPEGQTQGGGR